MLKAEDLLPEREISWPSGDLGSRRSKNTTSQDGISMDIVKTEPPGDLMDVDDLPPPIDDLSGFQTFLPI